MIDEDYIRKAVELADGWEIEAEKDGRVWVTGARFSGTIGALTQPDLDALAAQLVRQVDALDNVDITIHGTFSDLEIHDGHGWLPKQMPEGPDRTMNTIKAIVDSKRLE